MSENQAPHNTKENCAKIIATVVRNEMNAHTTKQMDTKYMYIDVTRNKMLSNEEYHLVVTLKLQEILFWVTWIQYPAELQCIDKRSHNFQRNNFAETDGLSAKYKKCTNCTVKYFILKPA